jgi:ABC-type amino acid transport substrate-binding protein
MMEEITMQAFRRLLPALLAGLVLFVPLSLAQADVEKGEEVEIPAPRETPPPEKPVAAAPPPFMELTSTSLAVGIGISWGEGTLSFEGTSHPFSVRGISLLDVGASVTEGLGEIYNLENLADFEGNYVAVEAAGAVGIGNSATVMRNEHGVEISLRSELQGVELALATQGFRIRFK